MGYILRRFVIAIAIIGWGATVSAAQEKPLEVKYSIVYLVHGDSDYLYHTADGKKREANRKVLQEAQTIGEKAIHGEVLIFHLLPERKILGIFPRKDRRFLHYRKGTLIRDERYSPEPDTSLNPFGAETIRYHRYRSIGNDEEIPFRALLYFGHEIPVGQRRGYHSSQPYLLFNRDRFVDGVDILSGETKFNLTILSTCENGTPAMAAQLRPYTQTLLASPQNLHLSHIDTQKLLSLEKQPDLSPVTLAKAMAKATYDRLSASIQTVISLSVYQLDQMEDELNKLSNQYLVFRSEHSSPDDQGENIDCSELPFFSKDRYTLGVTIYYRAARFGSYKDKRNHSGWGCRAEIENQ